MTAAVLDRGHPAAAWRATLRGPVPATLLTLLAVAVLATGVLPVVRPGAVLAGLAAAALAVGTDWLTRATPSAVRTVVVPLAGTASVVLLHAGTQSPALFLLALAPASALAGTAQHLGRQARAIDRLQTEQAALLEQVQSRADELDQASRILAARAQTMTSVIDAVTEQSIIGTDPDGTIRVWNPGAEKLLGLPRADVVRRRSILDFHLAEELEDALGHADDVDGLRALVQTAEEQGSDVRDWTYVGADGRQRTVSVAVTPRTDDRGVHAGWNFVGTDMTDVRATERMKDQFVSLISHELRTPLTSILGYLELVLDDDDRTLTDEQRQYLATVQRNADRLLRLVGDLLFTARVEAGQFTLQSEDVDLVAIVRAAEDTARVAATGAGVELRVEAPAEGLVVAGDPVRLGQACDNLVSNAVKFTPSGGSVTLAVTTGWQSPDGAVTPDERPGAVPVAQLAVRDTGIGIPNDEQGKLFTRFFRASTAQRNAVPGVGLGLSITKAITTAHGGTLDLVSVEGEGTTFTLTLPRDIR
ncbi:ATP-binding protein [Blastococcus sp. TF02-9]|uniref:sensor histidine kinase n=1 Tax=Blastococcus sp. TF02-09 TaxID=2250576 RepID=UPI0011BE174E|nr:ATP-binding protein [Blastococcus sp. TF02-9]